MEEKESTDFDILADSLDKFFYNIRYTASELYQSRIKELANMVVTVMHNNGRKKGLL